MNKNEVVRMGAKLDEDGHALTSFAELDLDDDQKLAVEVSRTVERTEQFRDVADETRRGMLMFRDGQSLAVGRRLVAPVFAALFAGDANARDGFGMYCINRYETGDSFRPHQDYFDGTVVIVTTSGKRRFDVYEKDEDDVFLNVQRSYTLCAGSIMLLNGFKNLGHAAQCIEGPSLSVVADVPAAVTA
jgi:hypothetical protein